MVQIIRTITARIIISMVVITIPTKVINNLDQIMPTKTTSWMNIMTSICTPGHRKMVIKTIMLGTPETIVEMEVGMCTEIQEEVTLENHTIKSSNIKSNKPEVSSPMVTAVTNHNRTLMTIVTPRHLRKE